MICQWNQSTIIIIPYKMQIPCNMSNHISHRIHVSNFNCVQKYYCKNLIECNQTCVRFSWSALNSRNNEIFEISACWWETESPKKAQIEQHRKRNISVFNSLKLLSIVYTLFIWLYLYKIEPHFVRAHDTHHFNSAHIAHIAHITYLKLRFSTHPNILCA